MADILSSHNKSVGIGQCTGFVFARVYEATGISIPMPDGNKMAAAVAGAKSKPSEQKKSK